MEFKIRLGQLKMLKLRQEPVLGGFQPSFSRMAKDNQEWSFFLRGQPKMCLTYVRIQDCCLILLTNHFITTWQGHQWYVLRWHVICCLPLLTSGQQQSTNALETFILLDVSWSSRKLWIVQIRDSQTVYETMHYSGILVECRSCLIVRSTKGLMCLGKDPTIILH